MLESYSEQNGLRINAAKTKAVKFRAGGPLRRADKFTVSGAPVEFVPRFTYLGVVLSCGVSFGAYISQRISQSTAAMATIPSPGKLSIDTAMSLFNIKIAPIAAYGLTLVWEDLSATQITALDKVKATFLKRSLCLHRSASNRLTYCLAGTQPFIEDVVRRYGLPDTPALQQYRTEYQNKMREIPADFYRTPAMTSAAWKQPLQDRRHIYTRYAVHGFHHKLCRTIGFHRPDESCICRNCSESCQLYHFDLCQFRPYLRELATTSD